MKHLLAEAPVPGAPLMLPALQFMRLRRARGCRIVCLSGSALVTVSHVVRDIDLHAGDAFVVPNDGLALVEAVTAACLRIDRPARR